MVEAASPVSEYDVVVLSVFATRVFHVEPPSVDLSILYPVICEPPLLDGAAQDRFICEEETAVAERDDGGCGTD